MKNSDIIFVFATSTTTNKNMINYKNLNLMKDKSTILIMSRAAVIDFKDLYKFLKKRNVFAGIDVYPVEPVEKKIQKKTSKCYFFLHIELVL